MKRPVVFCFFFALLVGVEEQFAVEFAPCRPRASFTPGPGWSAAAGGGARIYVPGRGTTSWFEHQVFPWADSYVFFLIYKDMFFRWFLFHTLNTL